MTIEIYEGDCRRVMRRLLRGRRRFHAALCDPPYHLESIVKRFGKPGSAAAKHGRDGAFGRVSGGFMGTSWDGADEDGYRVAEDAEMWRLCHDLLLPGAYLLAFGSPRTGHRMIRYKM